MAETTLIGIDMELHKLRITAYNSSGERVLGATAEFDQSSLDDWVRALRDATVYPLQGRIIVTAVGTSGTVVPVDEYGRQVLPIQWYFDTAPEQAERIRELDVARELSSKGLSVSATSPLAKVLGLREKYPNRFQRVKWLLSPTTWLLYRLCNGTDREWNDVETDWNNALKFGADITQEDPRWFRPVFDAVDVSLDLFPDITSPGTAIGSAESQLAEDMGIADAELYHGLTDGNASVLAAGCFQPGDCSIICGTSSVVKYVTEDIETHPAFYYHRHPIDGYVAGAAFDTGVVLRWWCENVLDVSLGEGLKLAEATKAGEEPRVFLQGDRSPFFNTSLGTTMFDLWPEESETTAETRGRLLRGIATSIALSESTFFPMIEDHFGDRIEHIRLIGGGSASGGGPFTWWNRLRRSIWDKDVQKMEPRMTAGALIPAALNASIYEDVEEASNRLLRNRGAVAGDDRITELYADARERFKDDWATINDIYKILDRPTGSS